jgi:hypothetical protein
MPQLAWEPEPPPYNLFCEAAMHHAAPDPCGSDGSGYDPDNKQCTEVKKASIFQKVHDSDLRLRMNYIK